jgi:hypothetical protein
MRQKHGDRINRTIPLWLKIAFTLWVSLWAIVYAGFYGPQNFLWLCNLCNFILLVGLWTESRLLVSSQIVAVLFIDLLWSIDLMTALLSGLHPFGGTAYMFNREIPFTVRLMSLYHVFTPPLLLFSVFRLGYSRRGLLLQTLITWVLFPATYLLADPERNVNWVHGAFGTTDLEMPPLAWILILMAACPLLLYLPTHGLVIFLCRRFRRESTGDGAIT